jgi:hypothetical protein
LLPSDIIDVVVAGFARIKTERPALLNIKAAAIVATDILGNLDQLMFSE